MLFRMVILIVILMSQAFGSGFNIDINPRNPQVDSSYTVTFTVVVEGDEEPVISFKSKGAKIIGRQSRGVSMRTKFVNGRLFTEKQIIYSYELESSSIGSAWLKDIKVKVSGKIMRRPDLKIDISKKPASLKNFFVQAEVDKDEIFVGEGLTVKYYIYSRRNVRNYELTDYPKLKKFFKRFINRPEESRNIEINGQIFRRDLLYSARVFAEKPGKYRIDPIKIKVHHATGPNINNPFNLNLNFSMNRLRSSRIRSKAIVVKVKPLPPAPQDAIFTGLVGDHSFKLMETKKRYLVNEAIELNFEVLGEGALEVYSAPAIYSHQELEEFEITSDFSITDDRRAIKVYHYTYLARSPLKILDRQIVLAYFDPKSLSYKKIKIDITGIDALGGAIEKSFDDSVVAREKDTQEAIKGSLVEKDTVSVVGPIFSSFNHFSENLVHIFNIFLGILIFIIIFIPIIRNKKRYHSAVAEAKKIISSLYGGEISYSNIFRLFHLLNWESRESLKNFIGRQQLGAKSKEYFLQLIKGVENSSYLKGEKLIKFKYEKKPFQDLFKLILKNKKNEGC